MIRDVTIFKFGIYLNIQGMNNIIVTPDSDMIIYRNLSFIFPCNDITLPSANIRLATIINKLDIIA